MPCWVDHFKCQIRTVYMAKGNSLIARLLYAVCLFVSSTSRTYTEIKQFDLSLDLANVQSTLIYDSTEAKRYYVNSQNYQGIVRTPTGRPTLTIRKLQFSDWPHSSLFIIRTYIHVQLTAVNLPHVCRTQKQRVCYVASAEWVTFVWLLLVLKNKQIIYCTNKKC